jgi:hypothetical protein
MITPPTTQDEHRQRHIELHRSLDELIADFILHHKDKLLSETTVRELMEWAYLETINPTDLA